jgi:hypothetical protein
MRVSRAPLPAPFDSARRGDSIWRRWGCSGVVAKRIRVAASPGGRFSGGTDPAADVLEDVVGACESPRALASTARINVDHSRM